MTKPATKLGGRRRRRGMALTPELVARSLRSVPDPGPRPGVTPLTPEDEAALVDRLLAGHRGPVSVFAYGSLIWKPSFAPAVQRRARTHGWHRAFTIELTTWRATPETPGLMLALDRGGACNGLLQQLPEDSGPAALAATIRREIPYHELTDNVRWITAETPQGPVRALVFYAGPRGPNIRSGLPLATVADRLARACGHAGSGAEYLYNTVAHLEAAGIRDRNLWRLQAMVAARIAALPEQSCGDSAAPETGAGNAPANPATRSVAHPAAHPAARPAASPPGPTITGDA